MINYTGTPTDLESKETSYPSKSLNFLNRLHGVSSQSENLQDSTDYVTNIDKSTTEVKVKLKIIVVGAGLGGLSTAIALRRRGHRVTVFEKAQGLGEVGAGIQVPPNSSRYLLQWGLGPYLQGKAVEPQAVRMRRWQSGEIISLTKLSPEFRSKYGAPYYVIHRADLQLAMYERALELGVEVKVNAGVEFFFAESAKIMLENGELHFADLIVAADGVKSQARKVVLGGNDQPPVQCRYAAYRAMVDAKSMKTDPDVSWLLDIPGQNLW